MVQLVSQAFHDASQGDIIPVDWNLGMSFDKNFDDDITFFTLNVSQLNGMDVLGPNNDNPLQQWQKYDYKDYSDRVVSMEYSREISFPYSVSAALADIVLDNTDDFFTPNSGSPIDQYILPKRPMKISVGYKNAEIIPQLFGITQRMPELDEDSKVASFHALDFLAEIFELPLNTTVSMRDVYTGEVIEAVLQQFGLIPSQYSIAQGRNRIPFVFFERRNIKAGEILRKLMQAEMGNLWLDEAGVVRFEPRLIDVNTPVMMFDESNINDIKTTGDSEIINTVRITSPLREVQEFQPIWNKSKSSGTSSLNVIPASGTLVIEASLSDPCFSVVPPTQGFVSNVSWFTVALPNGTEVPSGVVVTSVELLTNSYIMTFTNANAFSVNLEEAEVWGEPAKQYDLIEYELIEAESVEKYGEQLLEIENDFFQSESNCASFAYTLLDAYAEFAGVIEMSVAGDYSTQLGDVISVDARSYNDEYKIIKISTSLPDNYVIRARHYSPRHWFILNQSQLDSTDVLAP